MNKFSFDKRAEEMLFKNSVPQILHDGAQFEGLPLTILQTEQIVNNDVLSGIKASDVETMRNMHRGAQYVLDNYEAFDFDNLKALHAIVGRDEVLNAGELRSGKGGVNTKRGLFVPDLVNETDNRVQVESLINRQDLPAQTRASELFSYLSRAQLFDDTNKRTAVLAANVPLLKEGSGVFYIPEPAMDNTLNLMSDFYHSNDNRLLVAVLDDIAVSDYDGKTFYDPEHRVPEYDEFYRKRISTFKGLGPKGLFGKEAVQYLTQPIQFMQNEHNIER